MQDDRALTFQDIHGSKEALLAAVKEIERVALVESYEIGPLRLRFLEPYPQGGSSHDYVLTPARDYRVVDFASHEYVTVSYVWRHSQPIEGAKIPEYRIWDGADLQKPPVDLKCPPIVFHRVVQFTKAAKLERIWIDHECIDQKDPDDVEKHLQDMHRIYRFSRLTVAVFSKVSHSWKGLQSCFRSIEHSSVTADEALLQMVGDPWFTRSWTFHEQHCNGTLIYLLPTPPLQGVTLTQNGFVPNPHWELDKDVTLQQISLMSYFRSCEHAGRDNSALKSYFVGHGQSGSTSTNIPGAIMVVQEKMNKRANQVLSDRLQIIANVCGLGWKLKTTLLNNSTQSYSTCLLALTMANACPNSFERTRQYQEWGDVFMTGDVGVVLKKLQNAQRSDLWHLPGFRANFAQPDEPL